MDLVKQRQYVQNRIHWCWAVACKMVGEKYKESHPEYGFSIINDNKPFYGQVSEEEYNNGVPTSDINGINWRLQEDNKQVRVDAWQRAIVMNANTEKYVGYEGDVSGDDIAKERGLRYYLTGNSESREVRIETLGSHDSRQSLFVEYGDKLIYRLSNYEYMIGNMIIKEKRLFHSIVLIYMEREHILLYDPGNGEIIRCLQKEAFESGINCSLGRGIIKWVQMIV